jgi:methyl-accepting chemotaxis protein
MLGFTKKRGSAAQDTHEIDLKAKFAAIDRSQAMIEFELDGSVVSANENFLKTLGYRLEKSSGASTPSSSTPPRARARTIVSSGAG